MESCFERICTAKLTEQEEDQTFPSRFFGFLFFPLQIPSMAKKLHNWLTEDEEEEEKRYVFGFLLYLEDNVLKVPTPQFKLIFDMENLTLIPLVQSTRLITPLNYQFFFLLSAFRVFRISNYGIRDSRVLLLSGKRSKHFQPTDFSKLG